MSAEFTDGSGLPLSPAEQKRKKDALALKRERAELADEQISEAVGHEGMTIRGKQIRRAGTVGSSTVDLKKLGLDFNAISFTFQEVKSAWQKMSDLALQFAPLTSTFAHGASAAMSPRGPQAASAGNVEYDTVSVSENTARLLGQESEIIAQKMREADAVTDPATRDAMFDRVEKLAAEYDMRLNPLTKMYVHNEDRVVGLERQHGPRNTQAQRNCEVCVYRARMELGDVREIRREIADQREPDKGVEAQASGNDVRVVLAQLKPRP